jgi:hypothetical protein
MNRFGLRVEGFRKWYAVPAAIKIAGGDIGLRVLETSIVKSEERVGKISIRAPVQ